MAASGTVRVGCGRCLRTFCEVGEHDYLRLPTARPPLRIVRAVPWREPPELSPEVLASFPPGTRIRESAPGHGGRLRFVCHPKCRYQRVVPFDRWTRAVERALEAGHGEILVRYL
jgi:hypothetical protein